MVADINYNFNRLNVGVFIYFKIAYPTFLPLVFYVYLIPVYHTMPNLLIGLKSHKLLDVGGHFAMRPKHDVKRLIICWHVGMIL